MSEAAAEARHAQEVAAGKPTPTGVTLNPAVDAYILDILQRSETNPASLTSAQKLEVADIKAHVPNPIGGTPAPTSTGTDVAGVFGLVRSFTTTAQADPEKLAELIFDSTIGIAVVAAVLSVIPLEANFGGPLAGRLIAQLLRPWVRAAYENSIEVALRPVYPTDDVAPRLLVSGIEAGSISDDDLHAELVRSGVRPEAQTIIAKIALQKRFEAETKDDIALLRTYQADINRAMIAELQDELKVRLADLRATRKDLATQYRNLVLKAA